MARVVHVAVGVVVNAHGEILIAKRPDNSHQGGLWEFPGGKVEAGESLFTALKRELYEELAINILKTEPLIKIRHDYGDKQVLLDVHKVVEFSGEAVGNEGQPIRWVSPASLPQYAFPAANRPIITAITLPQRMLITGDFHSVEECCKRVESALLRGPKLIQLRVPDATQMASLVEPITSVCAAFDAKLQLNCSPEVFVATAVGNVGLHLNSFELKRCQSRPVDLGVLLGASCHNEAELFHAHNIGVDYVCLSPVSVTSSHPHQPVLGWGKFSELIAPVAIPVYALGGMREADLPDAIAQGAQGIAAISEWW